MSSIEEALAATLAPLNQMLEEREQRKAVLRAEVDEVDKEIVRINRVIRAASPPEPPKPPPSKTPKHYTASPRMREVVMTTLRGADRPLTASEIGEKAGIISTNIIAACAVLKDEGVVLLAGGNGGPNKNARLWALPKADRIEPQESNNGEAALSGAH